MTIRIDLYHEPDETETDPGELVRIEGGAPREARDLEKARDIAQQWADGTEQTVALYAYVDGAPAVPERFEPRTFNVRRFYSDESHPDHRKVVATGLTLKEAQAHCQRDDTSGDGWFDGYDAEAS